MSIFNKKKKEPENGGPFVSFVLLDKAFFSIDQLKADLENDWGIILSEEDVDREKDAVVFSIDGMLATVGLMPGPVPNGEAVLNAKTNFRWPEAVAAAEAHKAHLLVAILPHGQSPKETGVALVKLSSSCLKQKNATSINTAGTVFSPDFYIDFAENYLRDGLFPIMNLVFFGIYSQDNGETFCGYTYGMNCFCKDELEVLDSRHPAGELLEFLVEIATYVIDYDVTLQDGETIGFTEEQKLPITKSKGMAVDGDTLKIAF